MSKLQISSCQVDSLRSDEDLCRAGRLLNKQHLKRKDNVKQGIFDLDTNYLEEGDNHDRNDVMVASVGM